MTDTPDKKWSTISSAYIVNDRWLKLRADTCLTPKNQTITPWYVLEYPEWSSCLVIDHSFNVFLLNHYRYAANEFFTEIIAGIVEPNDSSPMETIRRELWEEIGYEGGELYKTGSAYANPSNQTNKQHTFLAIGGVSSGMKLDEVGGDFSITSMPFEQFYKIVTNSESNTQFQAIQMASIFYSINYILHTDEPSEMVLELRKIILGVITEG